MTAEKRYDGAPPEIRLALSPDQARALLPALATELAGAAVEESAARAIRAMLEYVAAVGIPPDYLRHIQRMIEPTSGSALPVDLDAEFQGLFRKFHELGGDDASPALDAVEKRAAHQSLTTGSLASSNFLGLNPQSPVSLPWWVIFTIAKSWTAFRLNWAHSGSSSLRNKSRLSMEAAFGLKGNQQTAVQREALTEQHRELASQVDDYLRQNTDALEFHACKAIAGDRWQTARRAYKKYRQQIELPKNRGPLPPRTRT
jgi:hypothetical protein